MIFDTNKPCPKIVILCFLSNIAQRFILQVFIFNQILPNVFSLYNLNNHLLSGHLFCSSKFIILIPPWSFARQRIGHLANLYFFFLVILPKKI